MNRSIFSALLILCFMPLWLVGQELPTEQVEVIKSFDARLLDAERENLFPTLPALDTSTTAQQYGITSKTLNVEYLPPKIRPLAMRRDALQDSYNGFARLGAGFPTTFYLNGSYDIVTVDDFDLGVGIFHHSMNNNGSVENQRFSLTQGRAKGTYYFDEGFAVTGRLGYTQDNVFYYGYNELNEDRDEDSQLSFGKADVKQSYNIVDAGVSIFNGERTVADFNYGADMDFYFMEDNYAARETGFVLKFNATKWFSRSSYSRSGGGSGPSVDTKAHPLNIELITDFTTYRDTTKESLNNFYLKPNYTYHSDFFTAKIGANVASSNDEFFFYPDVELSAQFADNIIGAFVGAEGSLQKNNLRSLSEYNPYIVSRIDVRNANYYHYYGGVKGTYQGVDYRAQVGYKTVDNLALFLVNQNADTIPRFNVLYDTASIISFEASVIANVFTDLKLNGNVAFRNYSMENQDKAWHLPMLTMNVGAAYSLLDDKKLTLKADFFLENGVPYQDDNGESKNLNTLFDVSVGADYRITENFGFYLQVNNLANNQRQRWQLYPTLGINAMAGLSVKF